MNKLYRRVNKYIFEFKNGDIKEYECKLSIRYGEIPKDQEYLINDFSADDVKDSLRYVFDLGVGTTLFGNLYISDTFCGEWFYHKVEYIKSISMISSYKEVDTSRYTILDLQNNLSFDEYALLIFDKEQSLKKLLMGGE